MRKHVKMLVCLLALALVLPGQALAAPVVNLWVHGQYIKSDVDPFVERERTLVPIRVITENLGYQVTWNQKDQTVLVEKDKLQVKLTLNSKEVLVKENGEEKNVTIDVPARAKNERTFVPLRAIGELFGEFVDWDQAGYTAIVGEGYEKKDKEEVPAEEDKKPNQKEKEPFSEKELDEKIVAKAKKKLEDIVKKAATVEYVADERKFAIHPTGDVAKAYSRVIKDYATLSDLDKARVEDDYNMILELSMEVNKGTDAGFSVSLNNPDKEKQELLKAKEDKKVYSFLEDGSWGK